MEILKYTLDPDPRNIDGINKDDNVYLTIQIGNGQIGGSKVILDGNQIAKGNLTQPTFLGESLQLADKEIEIETNVLDVNNFTNMCVVTTKFFNQNNQKLFAKIDNGLAPENGIASFKGKYKFSPLLSLLFFFVLSSFNLVFAQSTFDKTTFQSLETPASPGFILLDEGPSSIEKPTTPQGFGINILGLFQGTGGAMEVAPFWLANHPNVTAEQMYKDRFPILYNFSISAATIKTDTTSYFAGGFRTRLLQSYDQKILERLDSVKKEIEIALSDINKLDTNKIKELKEKYVGLVEKPIFTIDFAGAIGGSSLTNSFNDLSLNRWATWLSFNWRPKGDDFYITALTRFIKNNDFGNYSTDINLFDSGLRLNYDISNFCLSLEYIQRFDLSDNSGSENRIAAIGSYQISDNIYITTTFGKNFSDLNNIIAIAGINFGFSKSKVKAF